MERSELVVRCPAKSAPAGRGEAGEGLAAPAGAAITGETGHQGSASLHPGFLTAPAGTHLKVAVCSTFHALFLFWGQGFGYAFACNICRPSCEYGYEAWRGLLRVDECAVTADVSLSAAGELKPNRARITRLS